MSIDLDKLDLDAFDGHTPGPWDVLDGPGYVGGGADLCLAHAGTWLSNFNTPGSKDCIQLPANTVASEFGPSTDDEEQVVTREQRANADLCAAAPALLSLARSQRDELAEIKSKPAILAMSEEWKDMEAELAEAKAVIGMVVDQEAKWGVFDQNLFTDDEANDFRARLSRLLGTDDRGGECGTCNDPHGIIDYMDDQPVKCPDCQKGGE